jgi:general L-amino acid transport system permease protein
MAEVTVPTSVPKPQRSFSLYDRDVQAIIFQVIVLGAVVGLGWYLYSNTMENLQRRQIQTGFAFLNREAGFEIGESLIPYSAASTYGQALIVGLLNTLHVAIIGCVLATVLGVSVGIASLSSNWLLAKLTAGYIHFLRNIPVLLQIILWYNILISDRLFATPRQAQSYLGIYPTQRGWYFPVPDGSPGHWAALWAFLAAIVAVLILRRWAQARQERTGQQFPVVWASAAMLLGGPLVAWIAFGAPTGLNSPELRGFNFSGGARITPEFVAILFGLTIYTSAFIGEIVRAGILAVPKGQTEAGRAIGLKDNVILRQVILPQALRVIIPPLTSQYLNLTKNSSLAVAVGYPDLVSAANTTLNQTGQAPEAIIILMIVYLTISILTALLMNWYNQRIQLVER